MLPSLRLRFFCLGAALLLPLAGCAEPSRVLLPIPASIKNASFVRAVEVGVQPPAAAKVAQLDAKARSKRAAGQSDHASLPFAEMLPLVIEEVTRSWGLTGGRALSLRVEIDRIGTASTGATLLGNGQDRMSGLVFIADGVSGEPLGQLRIDVINSHSGVVGLLIRGGGIREELAEEFAIHIARALTGRRNR